MLRTDRGLSIPFPRILLRFLKILLPYVAFCLDITTSSSSLSSAKSSATSSSSNDIKTEIGNMTEKKKATLSTAIDTPEKRSGNGRHGSPEMKNTVQFP